MAEKTISRPSATRSARRWSATSASSLGEDVGEGGVFRATDGLQASSAPTACMDTPLAESSIVGSGHRRRDERHRARRRDPVRRLQPPRVRPDRQRGGQVPYRSNGTWSCPITIRTPVRRRHPRRPVPLPERRGVLRPRPRPEGDLRRTPYDAKGLLKAAIRDPNPVIFFEHKKAYRLSRRSRTRTTRPDRRRRVKREGTDITLITYGMMMHHSLKAAETVRRRTGSASR